MDEIWEAGDGRDWDEHETLSVFRDCEASLMDSEVTWVEQDEEKYQM
jgi:hypothetical protein